MAVCVLDASVALAWFVPDEGGGWAGSLLDCVTEDGAAVPGLWPLEVGNALLQAERRGRVTAAQRTGALGAIGGLPIEVDAETALRAWSETLGLAERFTLTLYDATYLELAQRRSLPLASLDRDLCAAGKALGLDLLGTPA